MKNIHLIKSNSFNLADNLINELTEGYTDINKFDLDIVELNDVINDASYYGLFNDKKAVIISNTKYFGGRFLYEEECELLYNFLSNLDDNIIVIFICNELAKDKDITKKVISLGATIHNLDNLKEAELKEHINSYLKNNNIKMDDKVITEFLNRVEGNIDLFINEVNKISIITKTITIDEINKYSSYRNTDVTFDFVGSIVSKNFSKGFDNLDILLSNGLEVPAIIGILASKYRELYFVKDCLRNNVSEDEIRQMLTTGSKEYSTGRLYYAKKDAGLYTIDELEEIIINLSELDKKIKTGSNPVYMLKEFLLNI
jgi:DNA polymerase III delta subunit